MDPIIAFLILAGLAGIATRMARSEAVAAGIPAILAGIILSIATE
jgi:hypothetical protein